MRAKARHRIQFKIHKQNAIKIAALAASFTFFGFFSPSIMFSDIINYMTYLFIAHGLSVVRLICDRIAVIHKAKIVELAQSEELFAHPLHPYTRALLSAIPRCV